MAPVADGFRVDKQVAKRPAIELPSTDLSAQQVMFRGHVVGGKGRAVRFHVTPLRQVSKKIVGWPSRR